MRIGEAKTVGDKIDALVCAIRMLVGQMQAEAERQWRWIQWHEHVEDVDPTTPGWEQTGEKLRGLALAADRRAAGLHGEARWVARYRR
jgi:hypothetical protein